MAANNGSPWPVGKTYQHRYNTHFGRGSVWSHFHGGTDPAIFRITRTNNLAPALKILYSLGGTATAVTDYTTPPATVTSPACVASANVTINPIDNTLIEPDRTMICNVLPTNVTGSLLPAEEYALGLFTTATATISRLRRR